MKKEYLFLITAGILAGFIVFIGPVFAKLGLSAYEISLLPLILLVVMCLPFMFNKKYHPKNIFSGIWILYGFVTAMTVFAQYGAVLLGLQVSITLLLMYTQPLWTFIITKFILREKISRKSIISCIIVLIGAFILLNPLNAGSIKSWSGVIVALTAGIFLSGWVTIGSYLSKTKNHPITSNFLGMSYTVLIMILAYPIASFFIKDKTLVSFSINFPLSTWIYLILFAFFIQIGVQMFYLYGTKKVPSIDAGVIMLLEPVIGTLLASIFLGQSIGLNVIFGGIIILIANYLAIKSSSK